MMTTFFNNGFNVLDKFKNMTVQEIKEQADADRLPFGVLCLNLEKDLNISNIIRSSHIFGAERVFTLGWKKIDSRGCVGSQHYTNLEKVRVESDSIDDVIMKIEEICHEYDYIPVFVEYNEHSKSIDSSEFRTISKKKPLLIFGNEGKGIPSEIMDHFGNEYIFHIDQLGVMRSLNVSSAAAVVLHEVSKNITNSFFKKFFNW